MIFRLLGTCLLVAWAGIAQAGLYKYVDENGNVTYSQTPPAQGEYEYMKTPKTPKATGSTDSSSSSAKETTKKRIDSTKSKLEAGAEAQKRTDNINKEVANAEEMRKQKCADAQKALETYTVYRRFRGEDGEVFYMDDNERQSRVNDAQQGIEEFCN